MKKRGGKRPGAGRPKSDPTKVITFRVKEAHAGAIREKINKELADYRANLIDGIYHAPTVEYAKGYIADCWDEQERYNTVASSDIELLEEALKNGLDAFNRQLVLHEKKYN